MDKIVCLENMAGKLDNILGKKLLLTFILNCFEPTEKGYYILAQDKLKKENNYDFDKLSRSLTYLFHKEDWQGRMAFTKEELEEELKSLEKCFSSIEKSL